MQTGRLIALHSGLFLNRRETLQIVEAAEQEKRRYLEKYKNVAEDLLKLKEFQESGVREKLEKGIQQIQKDLEQ